ncbi:MAG: hypothetical protein JO354_03790 [Verrucomicrobia bacterium]|nr:hypothetical protein [Verrucomicrobiota bacterium]
MKTLLLSAGAAAGLGLLAGCTTAGPQPPTVTTGLPYSAYARSNDYRVPVTNRYRSWSTAQLQERRKELYYMIPQTQDRNGVAAYYRGSLPLPQEDELRLVEAELNRRYHAGDTAAMLQPVWPESRRHV